MRHDRRNIAIWGELIINGSSDNHIYALAATTGELVWDTPVLEPTARARSTSGPIVADGKVITGRQCQPDATHDSCIVTAHDAASGEELWRARTIPRPGEPGDETWGDVPLGERWHVGTWMVPSYDPELDTIYIGTSVTIPAPKFTLGGNDLEHLYHNMCMNAEVRTGERDPSLVYGFSSELILAPGTADVGAIWAVSVETGEALWRHEQRAGVMSLVSTGGGLVFGGDVAGIFRAFDAASGRVVWEADLGAPVSGYPISFAVGETQFIAVATGQSLVATSARRVAPELPPTDAPASIFVFALSR